MIPGPLTPRHQDLGTYVAPEIERDDHYDACKRGHTWTCENSWETVGQVS